MFKSLTLFNKARNEHSERLKAIGMLAIGFRDSKKYSNEKTSNILENLNICKSRNIKIIMKTAELIKRAGYKYDSEINLNLEEFYQMGYNINNVDQFMKELEHIWSIISIQYMKAIKEIRHKSANINE